MTEEFPFEDLDGMDSMVKRLLCLAEDQHVQYCACFDRIEHTLAKLDDSNGTVASEKDSTDDLKDKAVAFDIVEQGNLLLETIETSIVIAKPWQHDVDLERELRDIPSRAIAKMHRPTNVSVVVIHIFDDLVRFNGISEFLTSAMTLWDYYDQLFPLLSNQMELQYTINNACYPFLKRSHPQIDDIVSVLHIFPWDPGLYLQLHNNKLEEGLIHHVFDNVTGPLSFQTILRSLIDIVTPSCVIEGDEGILKILWKACAFDIIMMMLFEHGSYKVVWQQLAFIESAHKWFEDVKHVMDFALDAARVSMLLNEIKHSLSSSLYRIVFCSKWDTRLPIHYLEGSLHWL
ncbi:hypothetical protein RJT34_13985 [Clitoria ternatea]|uniref:Uncharacterized protein n=1 Tax=Clitoria ternatea TaxID=43366 RepID=A0AAN9JRN7_CLITE